MFNLIKIEYFKIFKSKKNIILIFACLLLFIMIGLMNIGKNDVYVDQKLIYLEQEIRASTEIRDNLEKSLDIIEEGTKEWDVAHKEYRFWEQETEDSHILYGYYLKIGSEYSSNKLIAETSIQRNKQLIKAMQAGYTGMLLQQANVEEEIKSLKNENLVMTTLLDSYEKELEKDEYYEFLYTSPYEMNGLNYIATVFDNGMLLFIIAILMLIMMDVYMVEIECGSYKMYMVSPYSRTKMILAKMITMVSLSLIIVFLCALFGFSIFSLKNGVGDIQYPYINGFLHVEPCLLHIGKLTLLLISSIIVSMITLQYLSLFTKSMSSLVTSVACIFLCIFFIFSLLGKSNAWIFDIPYIKDMYISEILTTKVSIVKSLFISVCLSILLGLLSISRFRKLDLKGV